MNVNIKRLHPKAVIPKYAKEGDAGMDLFVTEIKSKNKFDVTYGFGIALEIPEGYVGLIFPRSSIRNQDLILSNSVGVIDSGYRGEIQSTFKRTGANRYEIGDKAAQIILLPYPSITFKEVEELSNTDRGQGGFGSTGK